MTDKNKRSTLGRSGATDQRGTVDNLIQAKEYHLSRLDLAGRSPQTRHLYGKYEQRLLDYLEAHHLTPTLDQLNAATVEDCQLWMRAHRDQTGRASRGGVQAERMFIRTMRIWAAFLARRNIIPDGRLAGTAEPRVPKLHRQPFTEAEAQRLLAAVADGPTPQRDRAIVLLMLDSGCRVGELCALDLADVLDSAGQVTGTAIFRQTKNGHQRNTIYRDPQRRDGGRAVQAIRQWLKVRHALPGVDALFTSSRGEAITTAVIQKRFRQIGQTAGVPNCIPHRCRHTSATMILATPGYHGAEQHLRDRLGHLSKEVLADYVSITDPSAEQMAAIASLSSRWKL